MAHGQQRCARLRRGGRGVGARLRNVGGRAGRWQQQVRARTELQQKVVPRRHCAKAPPSLPAVGQSCSGHGGARARKDKADQHWYQPQAALYRARAQRASQPKLACGARVQCTRPQIFRRSGVQPSGRQEPCACRRPGAAIFWSRRARGASAHLEPQSEPSAASKEALIVLQGGCW